MSVSPMQVHLTLNKIAPEYEGCELGIGDSIIMKVSHTVSRTFGFRNNATSKSKQHYNHYARMQALQQSTGRNMKKLRADIKERGDMGEV